MYREDCGSGDDGRPYYVFSVRAFEGTQKPLANVYFYTARGAPPQCPHPMEMAAEALLKAVAALHSSDEPWVIDFLITSSELPLGFEFYAPHRNEGPVRVRYLETGPSSPPEAKGSL